MTDHAAIARDQLRLAQDQLRLIDESAETAHDQLLVFLAAAIVHTGAAVVEALQPPQRYVVSNPPMSKKTADEFQRLVDESAKYNPTP